MSERPPRRPRGKKPQSIDRVDDQGAATSTASEPAAPTPAPAAPAKEAPKRRARKVVEKPIPRPDSSSDMLGRQSDFDERTVAHANELAKRIEKAVDENSGNNDFARRLAAALGVEFRPLQGTVKGKQADPIGNGFDDDMEPAERDIVTTEVQPARAFRDETFARNNIRLISDYADYRVMGWNCERAFIRVFGTDYADPRLDARIEALEHNLVFRQVFAKRFGETPLTRMFTIKHAVWNWLALVNNPFTRDSVKATALQQLQTLYGFTMIDGAGNTRGTKSLDDFYSDMKQAGTEDVSPVTTRHPEPGTEAAKTFEAQLRGESTGENAPAA
jgi:hypothetical protein